MHNEPNHEESTSITIGPECNRSETKQFHGRVKPNESDIYIVESPQKWPDPPICW
jgi:hypothetical protein